MKKQLVFIDDSGDPGFKKGASSSVFLMAGVVFDDLEDAKRVNSAVSVFRRSLGWKEGHEFKFRTVEKKIKLRFLRLINSFQFDVYVVYVNKSNYSNLLRFSDNEKLYNWVTKELLAIMPLKGAIVIMD